jgi:Fe-S cluster assembly protein SufD
MSAGSTSIRTLPDVRPSTIDWLAEAQAEAGASFAARGFPTTAEEEWRYTDISEASRRMAAAPAAESARGPDDHDALRARLVASGSTTAVFVDGLFAPALSSLHDEPGLAIRSLHGTTATRRQAVVSELRRSVRNDGALASLNAAQLRDGLDIVIAPGARREQPIHVVFAATGNRVSHARLLVDIGAAGHCTVIEHHVGLGDGVTNAVTNVSCGADARFAYLKLQTDSDLGFHLASQTLELGAGAEADLLHIDLGARLARNDLRIDLAGEACSVRAHGLFFADQARHIDNHTRIDHRGIRSTSRETWRGIADGRGRGVFNGKVVVHPGADKTDARLSSQNLLLSRTAEIDTKPELEIYADDVKCAHGATTGQLDDAAVFYLRSRGIGQEQARRMLVASFAREIVAHIGLESLRERVLSLLVDRLPDIAEIGGIR